MKRAAGRAWVPAAVTCPWNAYLYRAAPVLGKKKIPLRILSMVLGAITFRLVYTIALRLDMPAFMLKFVSAVVVVAAISIPYLKEQLPMLRRRAAHNRARRA